MPYSYNNPAFDYRSSAVQEFPPPTPNDADNTTLTPSHPILQDLTVPTPRRPPLALSDRLTDEIRSTILQAKGNFYVPQHGWDQHTSLPRYAILCTARNGYHAFCGPHHQSLRAPAFRDHFAQFHIMFQRIRPALLILWPESRGWKQTAGFWEDPRTWAEFKTCWAVLKAWVGEERKSREAPSFLDFLERGEPREKAAAVDTRHLELPPFPERALPQWGGI